MEYPKIAFKGDGTIKTGMKVVIKLVSLGASNPHDIEGYAFGYYFIDCYGNIYTEKYLPAGYKLVQLEQKLFKLI